MPRDYSHGACNQCARRRKKCGEERPTCKFCLRLGLFCLYRSRKDLADSTSTIEMTLEPLGLGSPSQQVRLLREITFVNPSEELVVSRVPSSVLGFFTTVTNGPCRDIHALRQLLLADPLVRDAAIACFSIVLPQRTNELGQMQPQRMGRALQTIRTQLFQEDLSKTASIALQLSILFIGLIESAASESLREPMHHWRALAVIVGKSTVVDPVKWPLLPRSLYAMILEALIYHMTVQALFCHDIDSVWTLWHHSAAYTKITNLNPESPQRVQLSPLLAGQYEIYQLVLHVTRLHRPPHCLRVNNDHLDHLQNLISLRALKLLDNFQSLDSLGPGKQQVYLQIYSLFCDALLICVVALKPACLSRARHMDILVATALARFLQLPVTLMNNAPTMWPVQVMACAIRHDHDFQALMTKFSDFEMYLDPGHLRRARKLFDEVARLRKQAAEQSIQLSDSTQPKKLHPNPSDDIGDYNLDFALPPAMSLLSRPNGVFGESTTEVDTKDE